MAIKPVSGKIESQEINDNLSYLDSRVSNIIATPVEGVSAQEIVDARGEKSVLGDKIRSIENGESIERKAVTNNKLNLPISNYLPETFDFMAGDTTGPNITRSTTGIINVNAFSKIEINDDEIEMAIYKVEIDESLTPLKSGWFSEYRFLEEMDVILRARFIDNREINTQELLDRIGNSIYMISEETALKTKELNKYLPKNVNLERGDISGHDGDSGTQSTARVRTVDFIEITADTMIKLKHTNITSYAIYQEGNNGFLNGGWTKEPIVFEQNTRIRVMFRYDDNSEAYNQLEFFRENFEIITGETFIKKSDIQFLAAEVRGVAYVTLMGNDQNDGSSAGKGYATLQKALDSGAKTIYVERGIYYNQTINKSVDEITILPLNNDSWDLETRKPVQKIEFRGSDLLKNQNWEAYNSIYRQEYENNPYFFEVFIDKTKPPETGGARPSYNATIWECSNMIDDYKLKPVLSLSECESEQGSFYYDGNYVYIHPSDINNTFHAVKLDKGLTLRGNKVVLQDIHFDYYMREPMDLDNIKLIHANNCEAHHSVTTDGISADYTNGTFLNSSACKNRNDGFNLHYYGDTEFVNCDGLYNYDDGISHHDGCTGNIIGGRWIGNGKGGVAPASGAKINTYNALIKGNRFGMYNSANHDVENISSGNLYINNETAIFNNDSKMVSFNDKFDDNDVDFSGNKVVEVY